MQERLPFNHGKDNSFTYWLYTSKESLLLGARLLKVKWIRWIPDCKTIPEPQIEVIFSPKNFPSMKFSSSLLACACIWSTGEHRETWSHTYTSHKDVYIHYTSDLWASFSTKLKIPFYQSVHYWCCLLYWEHVAIKMLTKYRAGSIEILSLDSSLSSGNMLFPPTKWNSIKFICYLDFL